VLLNTVTVAANVLVTGNFAFNFVLYCIVDVYFRHTCVNLVCCAEYLYLYLVIFLPGCV